MPTLLCWAHRVLCAGVDRDEYEDKAESTDFEGGLIEQRKALDRDGNGFITAGELRRVMRDTGEKLTYEEAGEAIRDADVDGDSRSTTRSSCEGKWRVGIMKTRTMSTRMRQRTMKGSATGRRASTMLEL